MFDDFLNLCKLYFQEGKIPIVSIQKQDSYYKRIKYLSDNIIKKYGIELFFGLLQEGQYLTQLWVAHLIIEEDNVDDKMKKKCFEVIIDYSDNPLVPDVSYAENVWLKSLDS